MNLYRRQSQLNLEKRLINERKKKTRKKRNIFAVLAFFTPSFKTDKIQKSNKEKFALIFNE